MIGRADSCPFLAAMPVDGYIDVMARRWFQFRLARIFAITALTGWGLVVAPYWIGRYNELQREQKWFRTNSWYVAPAWNPGLVTASTVVAALVCLTVLLVVREVLAGRSVRDLAGRELAPFRPEGHVDDSSFVREVELFAVECRRGGESPTIATFSRELESAQRSAELIDQSSDAWGPGARRARVVNGVWRPYPDQHAAPSGVFEVVIVTDQGDSRAIIGSVEFTGDFESAQQYTQMFNNYGLIESGGRWAVVRRKSATQTGGDSHLMPATTPQPDFDTG
jgi:hypothetical protein